ncbi:DNA polymerase beta domain protein region [Desulfonatronospira thiodismutans ASO3-1]|uniref:DNA polymerase beta domain protein region n=1 Tax=Desulfonatronospira thiodismutans ASO3-1 TaxID=555779 RepID=D6SRS2_9BACT|nr:nucleotidyltransferase domain-containing protein [Desulfonatronospira thiodismutans]EFI33388.1 DNA polymerase beta domain protein region [Desulfonatronospira thiodismutans ASO3-1]
MNRNNIFNTIKKYREKSGDEFGILRIGVFGSLAKGQENSASDVDVVVDLNKQDLFRIIGIKQDLEDILVLKVDVISYRPGMNKFLKERIDQEAVYV